MGQAHSHPSRGQGKETGTRTGTGTGTTAGTDAPVVDGVAGDPMAAAATAMQRPRRTRSASTSDIGPLLLPATAAPSLALPPAAVDAHSPLTDPADGTAATATTAVAAAGSSHGAEHRPLSSVTLSDGPSQSPQAQQLQQEASSLPPSLPLASGTAPGASCLSAPPRVRKLVRSTSSASAYGGDLSAVSAAIHAHLQQLAPTPQTPNLLTRDEREQKLILLRSLFQSIDRDGSGYVEREELLSWATNEPWLQQPKLAREAHRMLDLVTHDEDSRCSLHEFLSAFSDFTTPVIVELIVNLLRAGMVCKLPRVSYVYNAHDFYLHGLADGTDGGGDHSGDSPDVSPEPGQHGDLSAHDTPAQTLGFGAHVHEEAAKHFFLLEILFQAMDRDLDGAVDQKDLQRWLMADPFVRDNPDLFAAVDECWQELAERNLAAGFVMPDVQPLGEDDCGAASCGVVEGPVGPARIERHFFFMQFSQVPKKLIRRLLVHLLSRNAECVMDCAHHQRQVKKAEKSRDSAAAAAATASLTASPVLPASRLKRRPSVVVSGSRRVSVSDGLRVSLSGQAMLQHDIRRWPIGQECVRAMRPLLAAHVVFTEVETCLVREGRKPKKLRDTIFFHAASPEVLDVLSEMGFNLYSCSNNHAGDLGEEGLLTLMEEFAARDLCMSGIGMNATSAALPVFLDTPQGRIGLVSVASKVPEHSIALDDPPRPGVSSLSMTDVDARTLDPLELQRVVTAIEQARDGFVHPISGEEHEKADLIIIYHHNHYWEKHVTVNMEGKMGHWKRELAHSLIDAGAHIYVAHGDPRLQGLGNFIFQTKTEISFYGSEVWQSVLVHVHCHDINETTSYSIKLTPVQLNECGDTPDTHLQTRGLPRLANRAQGIAILHKLSCLSAEFGTAIHVEDSVEGDPSAPVIGWVLGEGSGAGSTAQAANPHTRALPLTSFPAKSKHEHATGPHGPIHHSPPPQQRPDAHAPSAGAQPTHSAPSPSNRAASPNHLSLPPAVTRAQMRVDHGTAAADAHPSLNAASPSGMPLSSPQAGVFEPTE